MKPISIYFVFSFLFLLSCSRKAIIENVQLEKMNALAVLEASLSESQISFEPIAYDSSMFKGAYKLYIDQPIDHTNPERGSFKQKVYLNHTNFDRPMVMYINGYSAYSNTYITESTKLLNANQIHVEHRFFNESVPADLSPTEMLKKDNDVRQFLNIRQAAADHHRIVEVLKKVYQKQWLSTGISKGGQATIFHKRFYPQDVAASIPYVAPINAEREDPRIEEHLNTVGTAACRAKLFEYQKSLLKNRAEVLKNFEEISAKKGYTYLKSAEKSLELAVLEFEFAFWQWSGDCSQIPEKDDPLKKRLDYLFKIDAPGFFTTDILPISAFFYQGYNQIGMYGYDIDPFEGLIKMYKRDVDNEETFLEGMELPPYDKNAIPDVLQWLNEKGNNMIYINGELDPWGATGIKPSEATNSIGFELKNGNHSTRMRDFSPLVQKQISDSLKNWLGLKIDLDFELLNE